jgi:hypothetical protein
MAMGKGPSSEPLMDKLTLFGLFAVTAMLVCYALENRSAWFVLAFAGACALGSVYGFLQGAWPFGLVEAVWAVVAVYRWRSKMLVLRSGARSRRVDHESMND